MIYFGFSKAQLRDEVLKTFHDLMFKNVWYFIEVLTCINQVDKYWSDVEAALVLETYKEVSATPKFYSDDVRGGGVNPFFWA